MYQFNAFSKSKWTKRYQRKPIAQRWRIFFDKNDLVSSLACR